VNHYDCLAPWTVLASPEHKGKQANDLIQKEAQTLKKCLQSLHQEGLKASRGVEEPPSIEDPNACNLVVGDPLAWSKHRSPAQASTRATKELFTGLFQAKIPKDFFPLPPGAFPMIISDVAIKARSWDFYARILRLAETGKKREGLGYTVKPGEGCEEEVLEALEALWPYIFQRVGSLPSAVPTKPLKMASCGLDGPAASCQHSPLVQYWHTVPGDETWISPFAPPKGSPRRYVTFEYDHGGWNNIRMAMETVAVFAAATGRTLVIPPEHDLYLLGKGGKKHGFGDFFHLEGYHRAGLRLITMEQYIAEVPGMGLSQAPPAGLNGKEGWDHDMISWLKATGYQPDVNRDKQFFVFPDRPGDGPRVDRSSPRYKVFLPENRSPFIYDIDHEMHSKPTIHFQAEEPHRLLCHFYTGIYFENEEMSKYMKRLVRDSFRYADEIFCRASNIVQKLREKGGGAYNSAHIRRGDFQFDATILPAEKLLESMRGQFDAETLLYIATDEGDKDFFGPIREAFPKMVFLDDFKSDTEGMNANHYGMLEQVIASKGDKFFGTWWSTFTGYINRQRGYNAKDRDSWYTMQDYRNEMQDYSHHRGPGWWREWPAAWLDIDSYAEKEFGYWIPKAESGEMYRARTHPYEEYPDDGRR
jgi:hypothetical protein